MLSNQQLINQYTIFSLVYCRQHVICNFLLSAISIERHDIADILLKLVLNTNQSTITIGEGANANS